MNSNDDFLCLISKLINPYLFLFLLSICINNIKVNSYLIYPLEYLPDKNYKFIRDNNINEISPEEAIQQLYFKNIITKIDMGNPIQKIPFLLETNKRHFYLASSNPSIKSNEQGKNSEYYQFTNNELYNELLSSSYKNNTCEVVYHMTYGYSEICDSNDTLHFNINNTNVDQEFRFKLVKNNDGNISGSIGLLYHDSNYEFTRGFITELKRANLTDNYYWFFNFDVFSPLEKKLKGQFILGGLPHEIFPKKYSEEDLITTSSAEVRLAGLAWRLNFNKIYIDNKEDKITVFENQAMTFNYEIYNVISSMKFQFEIRDLIMDELIAQNKCFCSNFSQNIYSSYNLTFYYCLKSAKDILYKKIPSIKFSSVELSHIFELTKEELFYEKGDYIYFMIFFGGITFNYFSLGQMFTTKFNFVFNTFYQEIGFYKTENSKGIMEKKIKSNEIPYLYIVIVLIPFISLFVGFLIGKTVFGKRTKKQNAKELNEEKDSSINEV